MRQDRDTTDALADVIVPLLEAEKHKRVERTREMAVRRIFRRDLTRGWQAWHDLYWDAKYRQNLLKASAARLARPKLAAAMVHWREEKAKHVQLSHPLAATQAAFSFGSSRSRTRRSWDQCTALYSSEARPLGSARIAVRL